MKAVWFNQLDFGTLSKTTQLEVARTFSKMGHTLRIVAIYRGTRPAFLSVTPRPLLLKQFLPDPLGGILFQLQVLILAVGEVLRKADLIMVDHFCVPTMLPLNLLSRAGLIRTRFVLNVLSAPVDMVGARYAVSLARYKLSVRWAKTFCDGIIAISDLYRKDISQRFRINPARIGVCTSGVAIDVFDPQKVDIAHAESIRYRLGLGDRLLVMYHGVLSAHRGLQNVVKALATLHARGHDRVGLILLGGGPAASQIAALAETEGIQQALRLIDAVPYEEVPCYLSICDAGILPFPDQKWWQMSSPLKLMEYLAMEKPVILTDIPAHRDIVGDAACGLYLRDNSPGEIARGIRMLAEQRAQLAQLGKQGREIVLRKFTWEKQVENLLGYVANLNRREGN